MKPTVVELRSQGCCFDFRPSMGESRKNTRSERNWTTFGFIPGFLPWAGPSPGQKDGYETDRRGIAIPRVFFRLSPIDGRKSKKRVWERNWTTFGFIPGFLPCLEKPTQNGGMKPTSWNSIPRVLFRFAPMGKVEKTRVLNAIGRRSSTRLFALLGKAHSKW